MELDETKRRTVYDNPNVAAMRDAERSRMVEAKRLEALRERQSRERNEIIARHHHESSRLAHSHEVESGRHSQYAVAPAGIEARQKKERAELDKRHTHERDKLKARHDLEIAKAKRMPPEAKIA
ncbi:MAG: hypothetical protein WAN43_08975 [Rhodomicrobium sp.]